MDGTRKDIYFELSGRPNMDFHHSSTGYKYSNPRRSTENTIWAAKPSKNNGIVKWRFVFYFLLASEMFVACDAAEPFDPSELDIILAYMLLQHGVVPWFAENVENDLIVSLNNPPIHLTLRISYNEITGTHPDIEDSLYFPNQESSSIDRYSPAGPADDASIHYENALHTSTGPTPGQVNQNLDQPGPNQHIPFMEISDTLSSRGADSVNDLDEELESHSNANKDENEIVPEYIRCEVNHTTTEPSGPNLGQVDENADQPEPIKHIPIMEISDTLSSRGTDSVNDPVDEMRNKCITTQEENELHTSAVHSGIGVFSKLSSDVGAVSTTIGIEGMRNMRNRDTVSFEERLGTQDNIEEQSEVTQSVNYTGVADKTVDQSMDNGIKKHEDTGGGSSRGFGDGGTNGSVPAVEDEAHISLRKRGNVKQNEFGEGQSQEKTKDEDELAIATGPVVRVAESRDRIADQRRSNGLLEQYAINHTIVSEDHEREKDIVNKTVDKHTDPLLLEGEEFIVQKESPKE